MIIITPSLFYYDPTSMEEEEEDGDEPVYFEEALDHQQVLSSIHFLLCK